MSREAFGVRGACSAPYTHLQKTAVGSPHAPPPAPSPSDGEGERGWGGCRARRPLPLAPSPSDGEGGKMRVRCREDCRTPRRWRVIRMRLEMPKVLECGSPLPLSPESCGLTDTLNRIPAFFKPQ